MNFQLLVANIAKTHSYFQQQTTQLEFQNTEKEIMQSATAQFTKRNGSYLWHIGTAQERTIGGIHSKRVTRMEIREIEKYAGKSKI